MQQASAIGRVSVPLLKATAAAALLCMLWILTVILVTKNHKETARWVNGIPRGCDHTYRSAASWLTGKQGMRRDPTSF
jgi:hypothetical protein